MKRILLIGLSACALVINAYSNVDEILAECSGDSAAVDLYYGGLQPDRERAAVKQLQVDAVLYGAANVNEINQFVNIAVEEAIKKYHELKKKDELLQSVQGTLGSPHEP